MPTTQTALLVIDIQNDYFPGGAFPLWEADAVLERNEQAILQARKIGMPVILVQHVADASKGMAPFFNAGTPGVDIHPRILAAAPDAPVIIKAFADSFHQTRLEACLNALGIEHLLISGMMTQNCVTHTALSRTADQYQVTILGDCCTTVSQMLHLIALNAVATRLTVNDAHKAFSSLATENQHQG